MKHKISYSPSSSATTCLPTENFRNHESSVISCGYLLLSLLLLSMQAIEFFFFAACIVGVAILFAIMAFFYKYVDLSVHTQPLTNDQSSDETSALILSQQQSDSSPIDDKGNESEF